MEKWWNWVLAVALFCLLFIAVPLSLSGKPTEEELKPLFNDYIKKFNKTYQSPEERLARFQHFVASVREIRELNALSRGPESHRAHYGLTHLSDMSKAEFKEIRLSDERQKKAPQVYGRSWSQKDESKKHDRNYYNVDNHDSHERRSSVENEPFGRSWSKTDERNKQDRNDYNVDDHDSHARNRPAGSEPHDNIYIIIRKKRAADLPMKVDWRDKNVVGLVRDQGLCGACWAFSTIGTMESMAAIKSGKLDMLSVQEVIDCAGLGNSGCAGGDVCLLLDWLYMTNTPVETEKDYPLKLTDGACKATKNATGVRVSTFTCDDFVGTEEKLLEAIATHGPVTVAVNALTWQHYLGGVIQFHCSGSAMDLNHAVQLVGYDLTAEVPYYIAKNSWGSEFGNAGYLMLAVGTNTCGLANEVATVDVV